MSAPLAASSGIVPTTGDVGTHQDLTEVTTGGISARPNGAEEMLTHTSAINTVDAYLYKHYVRIGAFSWDGSMKSGHVLHYFEINPFTLHVPLAHIMQLYNTWVGGFSFKFEIAGTGFNGGKLLLVRVPPNIDPTKLDVNSATILNSTYFDPKMQGSAELEAPDYRVGFFHMSRAFSGDYSGIQNSAGYVAVIVSLPLIAAASVAPVVNIQYSAKLAPDFAVGQMIPPGITDTPSSYVSYEIFKTVFDGPHSITSLPRFSATTIKILTLTDGTGAFTSNMVDWSMKRFQDGGDDDLDYPYLFDQRYGSVSYDTGLGIANVSYPNYTYRESDVLLSFAAADRPELITTDVSDFYRQNPLTSINYMHGKSSGTVVLGLANAIQTPFNLDPAVVVNKPYAIDDWSGAPQLDPVQYDSVHKSIPLSKPESLVVFIGNTDGQGFAQTRNIAEAIRSSDLGSMGKGSTLLFQLYDVATDTPLAYMRLWPGGYFTSNATTTELLFDFVANSLELRFHSVLPIQTTLPYTPQTNATFKRARAQILPAQASSKQVVDKQSWRHSLQEAQQSSDLQQQGWVPLTRQATPLNSSTAMKSRTSVQN